MLENDFIIMEDEEPQFIWDYVQSRQIIFHPALSPDGQWDYSSFFQARLNKPFMLLLDRNLFSYLLQFCTNGELADQETRQRIGALMTWMAMNHVSPCAILAAEERASIAGTTQIANIELEQFDRIFEIYPSQLWLRVAENEITSIPKLTNKLIPNATSIDGFDSSDYFEMIYASILHTLYLYKSNTLSPCQKMIEFFNWTYDNILLCQYAVVYAALLFTQQKGIKPPKQSGTGSYSDAVRGCKNQAWDLTYPCIQSVLNASDNIQSEFLFATNDQLLKNIYVNTHGPNEINGLLYAVFSKKEYTQISDYLIARQQQRKLEGINYQLFSKEYLCKLTGKEERLLQDLYSNQQKTS